MRYSSGVLFYRRHAGQLEVLLVHPAGNYNRRAPWSIPKGLPEAGEDLEQTARREACEETGVPSGRLSSLAHVDYSKSRKRVFCFAAEAPSDVTPRVGTWEVDQVAFMSIEEARKRIHPDQQPFLDRLLSWLKDSK